MSLAHTIAEIDRLAAEIGARHEQLLEHVADLDGIEGWRRDGATSTASWLVARLGVSHQTARAWSEVAGRLAELPAIASAFATGGLSFEQTHAICRFASPEEDAALAESAQSEPVSRLRRKARRRDRIEPGDVTAAHQARSLRWWWEPSGRVMRLAGSLPDADGAILAKALERVAESSPLDPDRQMPQPDEQRFADALVQMASQSLGADADADRATVVVHVTGTRLAEGDILDGPSLSTETIRRLACDARIETVREDRYGVALGIGRASRRIPAWLTRQLAYRDGGCRFPGCERERWVHAHHLVHWADGGPTDLDNLITLCGYHHRLIHEHGWRITGDPNHEVAWVRPDGTVFDPRRSRLQQIALSMSATRLLS